MNNYNVGVIVGRFQIDKLTSGHSMLINTALAQCDRLLIFVGTTVVRDSNKNPLDYRTREQMLLTAFAKYTNRISIHALGDCATDEEWSAILDRRIREIDPIGSVRLYGSRDSFISHYKGNFETIEVPPFGDVNATELRKQIAATPIDSELFRSGVIYGKMNQYPKVHPTVDVAIIRKTNQNPSDDLILLGKKHNETKWRLIGGFVDPTDDSLEDAALREGQEETGGKYVDGVLIGGAQFSDISYIGSFKIDDWRYVREQNKIITTFFAATYDGGTVSPSDDIAELAWHSIRSLQMNETEINKGHQILIDALLHKNYLCQK